MINERCPICNGAQPGKKGRKDGFDIMVCSTCGHWWAAGIPKLQTLDLENFHTQYCNNDPDFAKREHAKLAGGEEPGNHVHATNLLLRSVLKEAGWHGRSHLDVGCGSGYLLGQSKQAGLEVQGVEPGSWHVEAARRWQIPVENSFLRKNHFSRGFDLVTATDVIEHQADPVSFLNLLASNVSRGGLVVISFPYTDSFNAKVLGTLWAMVTPPTHCQFFSCASTRRLAGQCGLQIAAQKNYNAASFPILGRSRHLVRCYNLLLNTLGWGDQLLVALAPRHTAVELGTDKLD